MTKTISIRGARTHNLKNIDLDLPRDKLIVITGLSGSGKSSLAFDTIYAEGQRRYVESLSAYARQFLSIMEKPDIDMIEGLSPAIAIEQKSTSHNPRSTVGTITEVYDYLRLLFARVGTPHCPEHHEPLLAQTISQMVDTLLALPENSKILLIAPVLRGRKGEQRELIEDLKKQGFVRVILDNELMELETLEALSGKRKHHLGVVVDRLAIRAENQQRLAESIELALNLADGLLEVRDSAGALLKTLSAKFACKQCGWALSELEPRLFSFNSPHGACECCGGLGVDEYIDAQKVVAFPELSLASGAVRGWDKRTPYFFPQMQALAAHFGFDVETPFCELPEAIQSLILYGSKGEKLPLPSFGRGGAKTWREAVYEGVIPAMWRRYREVETEQVRDEIAQYLGKRVCAACEGSRLNVAARFVWVEGMDLPQLCAMSIDAALAWAEGLQIEGGLATVAAQILREVRERLRFLVEVGLGYLSLSRAADTLSGGEAQRIRLASQIGAGLVGVMYVLDEPSIGLHQRDNARLLQSLLRLRDLGNTVIVVEHDEEAIRAADFVVDIGEGAGVLGGEVVALGTPEAVAMNPRSLTGRYLSGVERIAVPERRSVEKVEWVRLLGASGNNLKAVDLALPIGRFSCVTGVSGSGKSTLVNDTFFRAAAGVLNGAAESPAPFVAIEGLAAFDKVVNVDQSPIGRTPRSNPATYSGVFTPIRELFAQTKEARARGYKVGRFSFNVRGGRCEACEGDGAVRVAMHFLPDIFVACEVCGGRRYNRETLEVLYKGLSIADVLDLTVAEAAEVFAAVPAVVRKLQALLDVGLGYIRLGQSALTLSGGEAQRVKLARELARRATGKTLYVLDEPTTGLHFHDVKQLIGVLQRLCDAGNTVVVIEHNLDVVKCADWVVDLGPEGGAGGGEVVAVGTPERVAANQKSYTGWFLKSMLENKEK